MEKPEESSAPVILDQLLVVTPGVTQKQRSSILRSGQFAATSGLVEAGLVLQSDGSFRRIESCEPADARHISDTNIAARFESRFGETPTAAELGLLKVLLCGGSLRDASRIDGRSYETKRNQLASLKAKAGLNGQSELLQTIAVLLVEAAQAPVATASAQMHALQTFMEEHYASGHRLHRMMPPSRRELIVADIGPVTGQPVIFIHSSFYPLLPLPHEAALLDRRNLRVIVPLRPGAFGAPTTPAGKVPSDADYVEDICHVLQIFNLQQAPVIGHGAGAILAVHLANAASDPNRRIVLSSPQYFCSQPQGHTSFSQSWAQFCSRHPNLIAPLIHNTIGRFASPDFFLAVLRKAYRENPDDVALYTRMGENAWFRNLLAMVASNNAVGLITDFAILGTDWPALLRSGNARYAVVYGERDCFSGSHRTNARLAAAGVEPILRPGFGQDGNVFDAELLFDLALQSRADQART